MKKLTAGIFTVLMGLVTVNAAEAAVASKGYVDEKVGGATTSIEALTQTVAANKTAAEKLVSDYKTENDAKVQANADAIAENAADILANTGLIGVNADAIAANTQAINNEKTAREQADTALETAYKAADTALDTRLVEVEKFSGTGEGSVAKQIADAVAGEKSAREAADADLQADIDAINNADTGILADAKAYADTEIGKIDTAYKAADTTLQGNIDALSGTVTAMDGAYKAADAQTLADAKSYADTEIGKIDTAYKAADTAINDKIGTVAEGKTVVQMIEAAQTAATYDDTEVRGLISGNAEDIAENAAAIATKLTDTTTISADGKYVLTAVTVGDDTSYAWELIERSTDKK